MRTGVDDRTANDAREHNGHDKQAVQLAETTSQPARSGDCSHGDERVRDGEQGRLQVREPKGDNYQIGKVLRSSVGDLGAKLQSEYKPRLRIHQAFNDLVPSPCSLLRCACACNDCSVACELAFLFC